MLSSSLLQDGGSYPPSLWQTLVCIVIDFTAVRSQRLCVTHKGINDNKQGHDRMIQAVYKLLERTRNERRARERCWTCPMGSVLVSVSARRPGPLVLCGLVCVCCCGVSAAVVCLLLWCVCCCGVSAAVVCLLMWCVC